jgi:hypothetical protein
VTSHLSPTVITDVNGRVTTVHKRVQSPQTSMPKIPVPKVDAGTPRAVASTPLSMPALLSEAEREKFVAWQDSVLPKPYFKDDLLKFALQPFDPETESLLWDAVSSGKTETKLLTGLLVHFHQSRWFKRRPDRREEDHPELLNRLRNSLLLAGRLAHYTPETGRQSLSHESFLYYVLSGYGYRPKPEERFTLGPITTEEELASVAAVGKYLHEAEDDKMSRLKNFKNPEGEEVSGISIANRSLDLFLRENPHEVDRVIGYVKDRGIGNTVKDTKALIAWLNDSENSGVLNDGWL